MVRHPIMGLNGARLPQRRDDPQDVSQKPNTVRYRQCTRGFAGGLQGLDHAGWAVRVSWQRNIDLMAELENCEAGATLLQVASVRRQRSAPRAEQARASALPWRPDAASLLHVPAPVPGKTVLPRA
jgi:hypothetical protein